MNIKYLNRWLLVAGIVLGFSLPAMASDCGDAVNEYNSAIDELSYALKRYTACVSNSQGKDDCSSEFRKLKYAQTEFEESVSHINWNCQN